MRTICFVLGMLIACGGTQAKTTIQTPQDYDTVVTQLIDEVIEIFKSDGINCELVTADLKSVAKSQKLNAAKDWATSHPDAKAAAKEKIAARKADIDTASASSVRQCGVQVQSVLGNLTSTSSSD